VNVINFVSSSETVVPTSFFNVSAQKGTKEAHVLVTVAARVRDVFVTLDVTEPETAARIMKAYVKVPAPIATKKFLKKF